MPLEIAEDFGRVPAIQQKQRHDSPPEAAVRPILLLLVGTSGSGRTTFYETHLKTAFPTLLKGSASPLEQTEADQERKRLMKTGESFVYQDVVFDPQLIREAKSVGFEVKAVYVATEDPTSTIPSMVEICGWLLTSKVESWSRWRARYRSGRKRHSGRNSLSG